MKCYLIIITVFFSLNSFSQNLVRNWSFEDTISCPTGREQLNKATYWFTPRGGGGSSELYSYCNNFDISFPKVVGVPNNSFGFQHPKLGIHYAGIGCFWNNHADYQEYIETKLDKVLDPEVNYYVEFWVSLANESNYAIENIGAYFSIDTLHYSSNITTLIDAQVVHNGGIISDTMDWVKVSGYFKPEQEAYQYLTIGNFNVSDSTNKTLVGWHIYDGAYYYIDNVVVIDSALQHTIGFEVQSSKSESFKFKLFPNPTKNKVNIEFNTSLNQDIEIQIYDVFGRVVLFENKFCSTALNLDISGLENGIYLIRLIAKKGIVYSRKLIIN